MAAAAFALAGCAGLGNPAPGENDTALYATSQSNLTSLSEVIEQHPNDPQAYNMRGSVYGEAGRNEQALADFSKAVSLDPNYAQAYANRALIYRKTNRLDLALADDNKALAIDAAYSPAYLGRGIVYREEGKSSLALGDFNHDGKLDFATSGNLLALGNGDGTFQAPTDIVVNPPSTGFSGIAAGDINKDGWTDLVLTNNAVPYNDVFVLLNNQHGGFTQVPTNFGATTTQPILVDLNGDGDLDLLLEGGGVYVGNGTGEFTFKTDLPGVPGSFGGIIAVMDVNGDGIPDLLATGFDTLAVALGNGDVTYAAPFYIGTGPSPGDILVANLHGQSPKAGRPDIVAPDTSGGVMVLLNLTK